MNSSNLVSDTLAHTLPHTLAQLHLLADVGVLRRLDSALAQWVCAMGTATDHAGDASALAVAAACVSHLEGQGHTAVPLSVLTDPALGWLEAAPTLQARVRQLACGLPTTEAQWLAVFQRSPAVACWTREDAGGAAPNPLPNPLPLVCVLADAHGPAMLGLHRHIHNEREVARALQQRAATAHPVNADVAATVLRQLFPALGQPAAHPPASQPPVQPDWQAVACAVAVRSGLTVLTGGPGTGKTYTAARLLALLWGTHPDPTTLKVALAAPTGKAAARLRQSLAEGLVGLVPDAWVQHLPPAQTLHSLLGARPDTRRLRHHAGNPLDVDVLLVDEASMVHLDLMADLLAALPPQVRLVLLGDKDQLASVEAGSVLGDVCQGLSSGLPPDCPDPGTQHWVRRLTGFDWPCANALVMEAGRAQASALARQTVMLRHSRRFAGGIGQLALAVNAGDPDAVRSVWQHGYPELHRASQEADALHTLDDLVRQHWGKGYLALLDTVPSGDTWPEWARSVLQAFDGFRLLCAVHAGSFGTVALNQRIQRVLVQAGDLKAHAEWYAGRPVLITRNDGALGVSNGDVGLVLPAWGADGQRALKACFVSGGALRTVPVGRLAHVETAFAMTVHKSQGSEFGHVALALPPKGQAQPGRELVYTGITRARERFTLLESTPGSLEAAVQQPTRRYSGLTGWLAAAAQG